MDSNVGGSKSEDETKTSCNEAAATPNGVEVWQTTQLDYLIGDLQRGTSANVQEATPTGTDDNAEQKEKKQVRRLKKKRRAKPRIIPPVRVYVGTFVHSTVDQPLQILENWMLGVDGGKIIFSESAEQYQSIMEQYKLKEFEKECIIEIPEGSFMMPGFVDCHTHVVPYLLAGLKEEHEILDGVVENRLNERRMKILNLVANDKSAANLFTTYITQSLMNGITCAAYNGSVVESAARLLIDTIVRFKQRAVIGLEMFYGDNRDDTHIFQIIKARDVAQHIIRRKCSRVHPCLILSKPLPDWLEKRVCDMAEEMDLPLKLTGEDKSFDQVKDKLKDWIEIGRSSLLRYHKKHGLLNSKSILVHCSSCSNRDMRMIAGVGASVVHCPSADMLNCQFSTLSNVVRRQIPVGLGTDLNTSHCVSMLETIRATRQCLKLAKHWPKAVPIRRTADQQMNGSSCQKISETEINRHVGDDVKCEKKDADDTESDDDDDDDDDKVEDRGVDPVLSYKELFRIATLGGATVLGLDHQIGNFEVGKDFDALFIQSHMVRSKYVVVSNHDTVQDVVEKFIFLGDDRNIAQVFIAGERIV